MKKVVFGRTGMSVSQIALGTWQFSGSWGPVDEDTAVLTIRKAFEAGINFFDTAHAYGWGQAEELLGKALGQELLSNRGEVVIASKGGTRRGQNGNIRDSDPQFLRFGLENSLRCLNVDYVDIFLLHWPDDHTPMEAIGSALEAFKNEGKIKYVGASNFSVTQLDELGQHTTVDVLQPGYNLLRRGIEKTVLPYCRSRDIGVFTYGSLAHGLLTGKYDAQSTFPNDDWRSKSPMFSGLEFEANTSMVVKLEAYAKNLNMSTAEIATAWGLSTAGVHCAIVGGKTANQVQNAARAGSIQLTDEQIMEINLIAAEGSPIGGPSPEGGVAE